MQVQWRATDEKNVKEPKTKPKEWFKPGEGNMNSSEVLFSALLLIKHAESALNGRSELQTWSSAVLTEEKRAMELAAAWKPPSDKRVVHDFFGRLNHVFNSRSWPRTELDAIGLAMQAWRCEGHVDGLTGELLHNYLGARTPLAVRTCEKTAPPKRWKSWAVVKIARLIHASAPALRTLLKLDVASEQAKPLHVVTAEQAERISSLEAELEQQKAAAKLITDAWRKSRERLKNKSKAVTEARRDERAKGVAKAKEVQAEARRKIKEHAATVRDEIGADFSKRLATARAKARTYEKTAGLSVARLKRAHDAEHELQATRQKLDSLFEEQDAGDAAAALVKIQSMPTWQPYRASGRGGGRLFDVNYRCVIFAQFENCTPNSAIGPNIISIVKATAPWLNPVPPSAAMLSDGRFELRTAVEACAAREVAAAYHIRVLGSDETTKFGNAGITSNVVIQPTPGADLKVVVLRGAYCSAGGTAEAIANAIDVKCFARGRDLLTRWKATCNRLYPQYKWTGPEAKQLSLGRLAGGGAIQGDTCSTAQLTKQILTEIAANEKKAEMGAAAWDALSEAEQQQAVRMHKLDCHNHMRNIFLAPMSEAMSKHVAIELKEYLNAFTSWERMTTDFNQLLRGCYKEFHHGNKYYHGKGREFWAWLKATYPLDFAMHLERADGGRQDLAFDAAVPMYILRHRFVEFLHMRVFTADHSNVLEDFLYVTFSALEYVAMLRANAVVDLLISRPLRWLAGCAYKLDNFSPLSLGTIGKKGALDLIEETMAKAAINGAILLNPELDILAPIAEQQPLFREWREYMFNKKTCLGPDGKTKHLIWKLARTEVLTPSDVTNAHEFVQQKTVQYLELQMVAGLQAMRDKKRAIAKHLASQDGEQAFDKNMQAHLDCAGVDATNDRLCESVFGIYDSILRRFPGISMEAASALTQAVHAKRFAPGGFVDLLPPEERHALIEMARTSLKEMRAVDRADHAALDAYHAQRRKTNAEIELAALIKQYALALSFFDRWKERGVASPADMVTALDAISSNQLKLDYLREQIEMRVIGLGFDEFRPHWSSSKDEEIGSVADLSANLKEILMEEEERRMEGKLPGAAVVPTMRRKTFKELGTATPQAVELAGQCLELPLDELLERAEKERERLETLGELDRTADMMPKDAPPCNESLIGKELEIRWRYWRPAKEGERGKKKAVDIWCVGEVVSVANGTTDQESPRCKHPLAKGAVRIKWPADADFDERETYTWSLLTKENWNKEAVLGWRYTAAQLAKLGGKRPKNF